MLIIAMTGGRVNWPRHLGAMPRLSLARSPKRLNASGFRRLKPIGATDVHVRRSEKINASAHAPKACLKKSLGVPRTGDGIGSLRIIQIRLDPILDSKLEKSGNSKSKATSRSARNSSLHSGRRTMTSGSESFKG